MPGGGELADSRARDAVADLRDTAATQARFAASGVPLYALVLLATLVPL